MEHTIENGGLPGICVSNNTNTHSVTILLHGATVISWRHNEVEKIFVSTLAVYDGVKAVRGGIPVVFPQFGQPSKAMAQHGFARNSNDWFISDQISTFEGFEVILTLNSNDYTLSLWPYPFQLQYHIQITLNGLMCQLYINNTGHEAFDCHALFHTYFRVPDIDDISVSGFQGFYFYDKTDSEAPYLMDSNEMVSFRRECDRIYVPTRAKAIGDVVIASRHQRGEDSESAFSVICNICKLARINDMPQCEANGKSKSNGSSVAYPIDVVLWNPWIEKAAALVDMDNDGYISFVCVEPGTVSNFVNVAPGKQLEIKQVLTTR